MSQAEDKRGAEDSQLRRLSDIEIIMLALSVAMREGGSDDEALLEELVRRVQKG